MATTGTRPRTGFTLLELIVVMAIIGIITGMVVPVFATAFAGIQLRNARSDFLSVLYHTQERAVAESREFRMFLDTKENAFWVEVVVEIDDNEKIFEPVDEDFGLKKTLPPYLKFERVRAPKDRKHNANYIGCYPNGACDRATIILQDTRARDSRFEIKTLGTLGQVEVKD
jgi:prepilin-type N-terminal cleavage/methylation domain-containing protein